MMYGGFLRRPDGFYPLNGIFLNFMVLCVIWQGIDWLRARRLLAGSLAVLLPLAWPFLASLLSIRSRCWPPRWGCWPPACCRPGT